MTTQKNHFIIALFATFSFACEDGPKVYVQFTKDDLMHLYYDKDTLTNYGQEIHYRDTVYFLMNSSDTLCVPVRTNIYSVNSAENLYDSKNEDIYGTSEIIFGNKTVFRRAAVNVSRNYFYWD